MGFGGSVSAMISSIKNNKRSRPSAFKKLKRFEKNSYKKGSINKKANPKLLKEIRLKTKKENKIRFLKNALLFLIIATIFFLIVWLN